MTSSSCSGLAVPRSAPIAVAIFSPIAMTALAFRCRTHGELLTVAGLPVISGK